MQVHSRFINGVLATAAAAVLTMGVAGCNTRYGATLQRSDDPVVLQGSDVPALVGTDPRHVVGFAWDGSAWHQIPVQVDERDEVSPGVIYHLPTAAYPTLYGTSTLLKILVYTPPVSTNATYRSVPTYTPTDSDPMVDANDEVTFLAYDAGVQATRSAGKPPGVTLSSLQQVEVTDPLNPSQVGYVYLFHSNTLTGGSGGTTGVDYDFSLDSGDYKTTYKMSNGSLAPNDLWGFNPESSTVTTPNYTLHFADRWLNDSMTITRGGADGTQMLDRSKYFATSPSGCPRTEDTFDGADNGEGAFIVNISGPVRAIRSYMGANSYKWTSVNEVFYPSRQDTRIELRGHAGMPGFGQSDDFATGTTGMTYWDPVNSNLAIDGVPDAFTPITSEAGDASQPERWQFVEGPQGSLFTTRILDTSIGDLDVSTSYHDESPAAVTPCTGDASRWGENGYTTISPTLDVPATDPTLVADPETYIATRFRYFEGPATDPASAHTLDLYAHNPLTTSVTGYPNG